MVAFNSTINPWRDRLTKINDSTTYSQVTPWIDGLNAEGSTNTLAALRFALADPATEAIYLLTDGRPDQVKLFNKRITKKTRAKFYFRMNDIFFLKFNIVKLFQYIQ
jgi:hypothetical protein